MNVTYQGIAITVDQDVSDHAFAVTDDASYFVPTILRYDDIDPDAARVREIADRLLDRSGPALTLEIMQQAIGAAEATIGRHPTRLIMSPAMRREYLALIDADRRVLP